MFQPCFLKNVFYNLAIVKINNQLLTILFFMEKNQISQKEANWQAKPLDQKVEARNQISEEEKAEYKKFRRIVADQYLNEKGEIEKEKAQVEFDKARKKLRKLRGFDLNQREIISLGKIVRDVIKQYCREQIDNVSYDILISLPKEIIDRFLLANYPLNINEIHKIISFKKNQNSFNQVSQKTLDFFEKMREEDKL